MLLPVPILTPFAALDRMPEEKQGMYWQNLDTTTLTLIPVKLGTSSPRPGGAALEGCPRLFLHIPDSIVGGSILHSLPPVFQELRSRTEALPERPLGLWIRRTPTCVMALAVVIAHEELIIVALVS